ncbi:molybdopterin-binding protein [Shimia abyssi]|uniref:Molybdenum cofactor cytidylyltransferase n=1 Tax=Shimia abyssi TaxID=1662395 RepID=A0A2P8FFE6_9RHOB|nr:molybdopterin-binding protein [Shimia abyssi]PSL20436.1 molybdenum cofactor cytidylyltransferase [Shimia abyssi]
MIFGEVSAADALGAILAHSVQAGPRKLRKGMTLEAEHVAALEAAGIAAVTVARLEPGDVHEDSAADTLAGALVPDPSAARLRLTKAFTGRVNLVADCPGVAVMDVAALTQLNLVDPMVTLATVPPFQQMGTGQMVGTVKIISYGVAGADIERACEVARGAIRLAPVVHRTASLIITDIEGGAGDKGREAIAARVEALGMELSEVVMVPHRIDALANAMAAAKGDMVMILTASATSDPMDVAPEAVRRAGGQVERFGMPVDPGNLLFIGALRQKPVIGLPGCARAPALNGADWVLARVACGIKVSHGDIAGMGVGGLLKEIPTRPMPRERRR